MPKRKIQEISPISLNFQVSFSGNDTKLIKHDFSCPSSDLLSDLHLSTQLPSLKCRVLRSCPTRPLVPNPKSPSTHFVAPSHPSPLTRPSTPNPSSPSTRPSTRSPSISTRPTTPNVPSTPRPASTSRQLLTETPVKAQNDSDVTLKSLQEKESSILSIYIESPKPRILLDRKWTTVSREDLLNHLIKMADIWDLDELSTKFFKPFQVSGVGGYFQKDGVLVKIPQYPHLFKVFTTYQALETLYNVAVQSMDELTPVLIQEHLVQFRKMLHILRPGLKEGSRRKNNTAYPPLPATVTMDSGEGYSGFYSFWSRKSGDDERTKRYWIGKWHVITESTPNWTWQNRKPITSTTFFNCAEYRPFLATSQLSSATDKFSLAQCLTVTGRAALQMCQDCRDNVSTISKHHGMEIIDRFNQNILIQENIVPSSSNQDVTYVSIPLKQPYAIMSSKEEES